MFVSSLGTEPIHQLTPRHDTKGRKQATSHQGYPWGAVSPVESSFLLSKAWPCSRAPGFLVTAPLLCLESFDEHPYPVWILPALPDLLGSVAPAAGELELQPGLCWAFLLCLFWNWQSSHSPNEWVQVIFPEWYMLPPEPEEVPQVQCLFLSSKHAKVQSFLLHIIGDILPCPRSSDPINFLMWQAPKYSWAFLSHPLAPVWTTRAFRVLAVGQIQLAFCHQYYGPVWYCVEYRDVRWSPWSWKQLEGSKGPLYSQVPWIWGMSATQNVFPGWNPLSRSEVSLCL